MRRSLLEICWNRAPVAAVVAGVLLAVRVCPAQVRSDEEIVFFPTFAHLSEDGTEWLVPIHGWIFEPETNSFLRRTALNELRDRLELDPEAEETKIFESRVRWLLVDNERDKIVSVKIGGKRYPLGVSGEDGRFMETLHFPVDDARKLAPEGRIEFRAILPEGDEREFAGSVRLVEPEGLSVISDIDDTVKVTEVTDKSKLIRNTFFREFAAVDGMAPLYRKWAEQGAVFHFVSSSPWQLFEPLRELMNESGFPEAAWHLKPFRVKDVSAKSLFADPTEYKLSTIEPILKAFPKRRFLLVGDSGEKDPEIYGELARQHPEQIEAIYIRDVTGETREAERYGNAFRDVPGEKWRVFGEPKELPGPDAE
jgi:hypothetical protein